jgi:hypothetical protein
LSNFQIVSNVDSDLDGVPDYLEDIKLTTNRPFLGAPVVITGTIEAEQLDMGGPGFGYSNVVAITNSTYRPTGMAISACNDLGGGYCLDQTQSNDWAKYTINVLVSQNYMVETRVAGLGTNGAFKVEFTNGTNYTDTGTLVITNTNWTNLSAVVSLKAGTNVMELLMLTNANTNGAYGANVGRFNYISIYPYWTNAAAGTNLAPISAASLYTNSDWGSAKSNAIVIQNAVNSLGSGGGIVTIPEGTWYVSQAVPNDANPDWANTAACVTNSDVTITGSGTNATNTLLIANNRSTTIFVLGVNTLGRGIACSNFMLCDLTLEAQPHAVATNSGSSYTNIYELGQLIPQAQGSIATFYGISSNQCSYNICISNCVFLHGIKSLVPDVSISNFMVVNCQFTPMDTNCYFNGATNGQPLNNKTPTANTTNWQTGNVAVFGNGPVNAVIVGNTYIGNAALTAVNTNAVSTLIGYTNWPAADGFVWFQKSGNVFVARNIISNNALEGVQLNAGPNSVVGNTYNTLVSDPSCCAFCVAGQQQTELTGTPLQSYSSTFIGNQVYGGRHGVECTSTTYPFTYTCSGNSITLYPAIEPIAPLINDYPGYAADAVGCESAIVSGNTLSNGGLGFLFSSTNGNALIMNNNFEAASYCGIGYQYIGDSLNAAQIYGNSLGQGVNFHVQLPYTKSFSWFLGSNTYWNINSNPVPLFADPASSSIHIYQ